MESATVHPLQSFADLITIEEYKRTVRPKVVLSWAPHPKGVASGRTQQFRPMDERRRRGFRRDASRRL